MIAHRAVLAILCFLAWLLSRDRREHKPILLTLCALCAFDLARTLINGPQWVEIALYIAWPTCLITLPAQVLLGKRRRWLVDSAIFCIICASVSLMMSEQTRGERMVVYILMHGTAGAMMLGLTLWWRIRHGVRFYRSATDMTVLFLGAGELAWTFPLLLLARGAITIPQYEFVTGLQSLAFYLMLGGLHIRWILRPPPSRRLEPSRAPVEPSPA